MRAILDACKAASPAPAWAPYHVRLVDFLEKRVEAEEERVRGGEKDKKAKK